jgi:ComF family protein
MLMLQIELPSIDAIVPVPMHPRGLRERGFNQSLLLAKVISKGSRVPLVPNGLLKEKDTPPQLGLTAKERVTNLSGAFSAVRSFSGMSVLLVDDVMTTGSTARACSKALLKAEAKSVTVLTLARASVV